MAPPPLEAEVHDHIFCDPLFAGRFLPGDRGKLQKVLQLCHKNPVYSGRRKWTLPRAKKETKLRRSVGLILNAIKEAVDATCGSRPTTSFLDRFGTKLSADCELSSLTRPDIVMFNYPHERHEHWETVRMTVQVAQRKTHLKSAISGLAFNARAIFSHQIHRTHLYALAICGTEATFVRFDRSGVLYSPPIDVCADSDQFTKALAALLMKDDETFGYDAAFRTRMGDDQRLDYYVDLPESALGDGCHENDRSHVRSPTLKFKVVERLCHRMDIIGRATIVLRIQRVKPPKTQQEGIRTRGQKRAFEESQLEELHEQSYVLKLMWRDPEQESEGPILEQLVGIYGVVQHLWHSDVHRSCKRRHLAGSGCEMCLDETPEVEDMLVCENFTNIQHAGRMTGNRDVYEPIEVNTKKLVPTTQTRRRRIYSRILLSSVGKPLWAAESPRELLMGILDAIMGCWSLMNLGVLHRDISGGNVMLVCSDQHDRQRKWLDEVDESEEISDSEARLREYLAIFSRDPTGMLSDFDLHVQLSDGDLSTSLKSESASSNTSLLQDPEDTIRRSFAPEPQGSSSPHPKRRKTEDSYVSVPASAPSPIRPIRLPRRAAPSQTPTHEKIDYRVGTTPFMSVNVLNVQPGEPYEHSFMDDLESFFWVLFYVMVEHTDPGVDSPNHEAKEILDLLDSEDEDMHKMRLVKVTHLENCHRHPEKIVKMLHKTQNGWACDKTLTQTLIQLGSFFSDNQEVALSDLAPAKAFPIVVDIFVEALEKM